jgi:methionyl-tRNA formyltransferase
MTLNIAVLSNHFSGLDALVGLNRTIVPINLLITNDINAHKGVISGAVDLSSLDIEIIELKSFDMKKDIHRIIELKIDILLVMGFQRLVPEEIINSVKVGAFGFHGSSEFLPKGRGRSPINWGLIAGKKRFIPHMFKLESGPDSGDVVDHMIFEINNFDDCRSVYYKASLSMRTMIERTIPKLLSGGLVGTPQTGEPSFFQKRTPSDGVIDWSNTTEQIHNWVRALTKPYPGALSAGLTIWRGQPFSDQFISDNHIAGQVLEIFHYGEILIKTGDGSFLITDYQGDQPKKGDILEGI